MNKKIIAIAIASAMAAPVAMADVKITGQLGAALVFSDKNAGATPTAGTAGKFDDAAKDYRGMQDSGLSKLDFKGTSGNAYAHIGMDIRNLMAGQSLAGRDLYLGYKLGAGSVQAGRMPSALAGLEGDKYNATFLEMRRTAAVATTENTLTDSFTASPVLQYAAKMGGAAVKIQYDVAENSQGSAAEGYLAVSVKGKAGAVGYFAGYNNGKGTAENGVSNSDSNMKVGASMKFGAVKATLVYMAADDDGTKDNATAILADMGMGEGMSVGVGYGTNKAKDTWTRLAMTKSLNKGAKVFAGMTIKDPDGSTAGTTFGAGMAVKF